MTAAQFRPEDHPRSTGGQFVETMKPEAQGVEPLKLFDREDGSFLNPPASRTAEHCIKFWSTVEIPDEIVVAFRDAQRAEREQRVQPYRQAEFDAWYQQWAPSNPGATAQQWTPAWEQYAKTNGVEERLEEKVPSLAYQDASQAIRALQMIRMAPDEQRWPEETQTVREHQIETFRGVVPALELCKTHKLIRVAGVLDRMPEQRVQGDGLNPAIVQALNQLIQETRGVRDDLDGIGDTAIDMQRGQMTGSY
ncbi:hypothetical protein LG293_16450 (plasmid) [Citricoccus nitrophenolicus]